jgi:hypothetical protein
MTDRSAGGWSPQRWLAFELGAVAGQEIALSLLGALLQPGLELLASGSRRN